jgi:transcriptional regulator with XRE-family HTH domain
MPITNSNDAFVHLGFFEKNIRNELGLSLDNVAEDLNMSKTSLWKAEKGQMAFPKEKLEQFIALYDVPFYFDEDIPKHLCTSFAAMYNAYIQFDKQLELEIMAEYEEKKDIYLHSTGYFYALLFEYYGIVYASTPDHLRYKSLYEILEEHIDLFLPDMQAAFWDMSAHYVSWQHYHAKGYAMCDKGLDCYDEQHIFGIKGMLLYNKLRCMAAVNMSFKGFSLCEEAREAFLEYKIYRRAIYIDNREAIFLAQMQQYEAAETKFSYILSNIRGMNDPVMQNSITQNLVWTYILDDKYQMAIDLILKYRSKDNAVSMNFIYLPYCYYQLGQFEKAEEETSKLIPIVSEAFDKAFLLMLLDLLKERPKGFERHAKMALRQAIKDNEIELAKIVTKFQIQYYEKSNDEQAVHKLIAAQKDLIDLWESGRREKKTPMD